MSTGFSVRWVAFCGAHVPVIMQNENGPCPLLAIANVASLVRRITLPPGTSTVTSATLLQLVAEYLLSYNDALGQRSELDALTVQASIAESLELLPRMLEGSDMDPRFSSGPCGFVSSPQTAFFEAADVRLMHGWLPDADSEPEAAEALKGQSYDSAMTTIVGCLATPASPLPSRLRSVHRPTITPLRAPSTFALVPASGAEESKLSSPVLRALLSRQEDLRSSPTGEAATGTPTLRPLASPDAGEAAGGEVAPLALASPASAEASPSALSSDTARARVMDAWLDVNRGQLTVAGVRALRAAVRPQEVTAFFRNNHFSTLYASEEGRLFMLVTDSGFMGEPSVVWESLDEGSVRGGGAFFDALFRPSAAGQGPAGHGLQASADHALALQLQAEEQQEQGNGGGWQAPGGGGWDSPPPAVQPERIPLIVPSDMHGEWRAMGHSDRQALLAALGSPGLPSGAVSGAGAAAASPYPMPLGPPPGIAPPPSAAAANGIGRNDRYGQQAANLREMASERAKRNAQRPPGTVSAQEQARAEVRPPGGKGASGDGGCLLQ